MHRNLSDSLAAACSCAPPLNYGLIIKKREGRARAHVVYGFSLCQLDVRCRPFLRARLAVFTLNMQITFAHAARVVVYAPPDSIISSLRSVE
jgi:hypothetical protein